MVFKETEFRLKDGRSGVLPSPSEDKAEEMLRFIKKASGETEYLMKYPEEWEDFTLEQEKAFLREDYDDQNRMMISCFVDGIPTPFQEILLDPNQIESVEFVTDVADKGAVG